MREPPFDGFGEPWEKHPGTKSADRPKLPRGLRWRSNSPFIWFSWRDSRGRQHQQSTETDDPAKALSHKLEFLAKYQHEREDLKAQAK